MPRLLIGVGNPDGGDDGAGTAVARQLRGRNDCALEGRECTGEATSLMSA
jgi:Ni,Fe-hydrogenase maturation factor